MALRPHLLCFFVGHVLAVRQSHFTRGKLLNLHLGTPWDVKQFKLFKALFVLLSWAPKPPKSTLFKWLQWPPLPCSEAQTWRGGFAPRFQADHRHLGTGGAVRVPTASWSWPTAPCPTACKPPGKALPTQLLRAARSRSAVPPRLWTPAPPATPQPSSSCRK